MDRTIDFYFDFTSPYAYLAAARIDAIAAAHGRKVRWHPVLLAALSEATGVKLSPFVPAKWKYVQHDLQRSAARLGLPMQLPPGFPRLWISAPRAMLWIREHHGEEVASAFARSCFNMAFGAGVDLENMEVLADLAGRLGVAREALEAGVASPAIKSALKENIAAAIGRGVFGVPFVVMDGEAFWGADRLAELECALADAASS